VAKNLVAAGLADKAEVQLSYAIGVAHPTSIFVDSFGTVKQGLSDTDLSELVNEVFDLRPAAIIQKFELTRLPALRGGRFYQNLAAYGHIGRSDLDVPWEALDAVSTLQALAKARVKEVVANS
jgi:S-adenosylmethionine synthetase